jgi:hypothetical protein
MSPVGIKAPRYVTVGGVSAATVYKLCERGLLRHVRIADHSIRVTEADLADFVSGRTTTTGRRQP